MNNIEDYAKEQSQELEERFRKMKYKVKSKREAIYLKSKILDNLYSLEDLMNYRKNKITKMIDFLQKIDFEVE